MEHENESEWEQSHREVYTLQKTKTWQYGPIVGISLYR